MPPQPSSVSTARPRARRSPRRRGGNASAREVARAVERAGYAAYSQAAAAEAIAELFGTVRAALGAIAGIALAVAALGIANALLTSVSERTVEIGVLKALGATDATVERLFLVEASVLGLLGGAAGVALGWLGAALAAVGARQAIAGADLAPQVDAPLVSFALLVALALSLLAGWLPARRAARLVPAEALRAE